MRFISLRGALWCAVALLASAGARAQTPARVVIAPLLGDSEESMAASLLLASMLTKGDREPAPFGDVLRKLAEEPGAGKGKPTALCGATKSDRAVVGELRLAESDLDLVLRGVDCSGIDVFAIKLKSSRGELQALMTSAATALAPNVGLKVSQVPLTQMGQLRPAARAMRALLGRDYTAAVTSLQLSDPKLARRISAVRELGRLLAAQPGLAPFQRLEAALAAADPELALSIAAGQKGPASVELAAGVARAYVQQGDLARASQALAAYAQEKSPSAALTLARMEIALAKGDKHGKAEVDKLAQAALQQGTGTAPIMALMARQPPKLMSPAGEAALLAAAQKLPPTAAPGVASAVGARAAAGNNPEGVGLMQMDDYDAAQLNGIMDGLQGSGGTMGQMRQLQVGGQPGAPGVPGAPLTPAAQLQAVIGARTKKPTATAVKVEKKIEAPADTLPRPMDSGLPPEVMGQFGKLLGAFPRLAEGRGANILVAPRTGTAGPWYRPAHVDLAGLHQALRAALTQEPLRLSPQGDRKVVTEYTPESLAELAAANDSRFVLLYSAEPLMEGTNIKVLLFDQTTGEAFDFGDRINTTVFRKWNPLFGALLGLLVLLGLGLVARVLAGGSVEVDVTGGPYGQRQVLYLELSRSAKAPAFPTDTLEADVSKLGKSALRQLHRGRKVRFSRVAKGPWFVHGYGLCEIGGKAMALVGALTETVEVQVGKVSKATLAMRSPLPHVRVEVTDGDKPVQLRVYLNGVGQPVETDAKGEATVDVTVGRHNLHFRLADGTEVVRPVQIVANQRPELVKVDLQLEHRLRPIEMQRDEPPEPYRSPVSAAVMDPEDPSSAAPPRDESNDLLTDDNDFSTFAAPPVAAPAPAPAAPPPAIAPAPPPDVGAPEIEAPSFAAPAIALALAAEDAAPSAITPIAPVASVASAASTERYRREGELGRTPAATVFRGRDTVEQRPVALHVISDELRANPAALAGFFEDSKAIATLREPHLLAVFDVVDRHAEPFVVTELAGESTLATVLRAESRLSLPDALRVAAQIASALAAAHRVRLVHRDVRPTSIVVDASRTAKLGGFGVGRAARVGKNKRTLSPLYLAPEEIRGEELDAQSDLYAFGCTLYEMLVGAPPFSTGDVVSQHLHTDPPVPSRKRPEVPAALDALVLSCLAKEKYERLRSADELKQQLAKLIRSA